MQTTVTNLAEVCRDRTQECERKTSTATFRPRLQWREISDESGFGFCVSYGNILCQLHRSFICWRLYASLCHGFWWKPNSSKKASCAKVRQLTFSWLASTREVFWALRRRWLFRKREGSHCIFRIIARCTSSESSQCGFITDDSAKTSHAETTELHACADVNEFFWWIPSGLFLCLSSHLELLSVTQCKHSVQLRNVLPITRTNWWFGA